MKKRLENDVAVITGAARGLDRAIALEFARHGCHVCCCDINLEGAQETAQAIADEGGSAEAVYMDVSSSACVNEAMRGIFERCGRITILVNGAFWSTADDLDHLSDEDWNRALQINLTGYFYTLRAVHPYMKQSGGGRIVQLSSTSGKSGGSIGSGAHYVSTKAGIIGLTKYVANHWYGDKIRCNTICPGATDSPVLHSPGVDQELVAKVEKTIPLGRLCYPEDIAKGALFLASDESAYITGITLDICGGRYMYGN
ncbi:MAG: SDR family oxidoreductase [Firmicutes bacterium]|nr:SDR family oxidoreductase [Bacillota bacterium]